ncbi:MAG: BMP family ABC transporter substrate-binding protein [Rhodococcus sp. (in: high G+C Gram-positive bacteria)]|uniref:BMP family protein n=1 Tax=Rhodococcus sp. TaxID=1831 RepID=UPI0012139D6A|nr:BMP family protein [Rhodococcus sp. (in: high G+C Gram-positive bacteria)]RZL23501.1 MAG: BMP family ABC transporter substrate-binding protein [Rhodococcus sp. (in: high G+C Gram-positive bacteria)]
MKLPLALAAVAATALTLTSCSSADSEPSSDALSVGVFFPGSISDTGFMESGYLGYQRMVETYGDRIDASYVEQVAAADYQQALQRFASTNDLVISVGGQTDADVRKIAAQFPDVKFVEIGGPADAVPLDNLAYYDPQQAEAEFLSGAVAASVSKTGTVGFVGGVELPAIVNAASAFQSGATLTRPDIRVLSPQYVGDFNDPAKAKQAASAEFSGGADVLGQIVNLGKQGLQQAAREAGGTMSGGPIPGDCSDPTYLGYVRTDIGTEIEYAVSSTLDGTWAAEQVPFGLTSDKGGTDYVLCSNDPAAAAALTKAKATVADGTVKLY